MKKNTIKLVGLTLAIGATLGLASCDKPTSSSSTNNSTTTTSQSASSPSTPSTSTPASNTSGSPTVAPTAPTTPTSVPATPVTTPSNPISNQDNPSTPVVTPTAPNSSKTVANKVSNAVSNVANAVNNAVNSTVKAVANKVGNATNYPLTLEQIVTQIKQAENNPAQLINVLSTDYPVYLAQAAGLKASSPVYQNLVSFAKTYVAKQALSPANYSVYSNFAMDVGFEALNFLQQNPQYGYPALPTSNAPGTYQAYKTQFLNTFVKNIQARMAVYQDPNFQKKFLDYKSDAELPGLMSQFKYLIDNYTGFVTSLASQPLVCSTQATELDKATCFRTYMTTVSAFPKVLLNVDDLRTNNADADITPAFTDSAITPLMEFYTKYYATSSK